MSGAGGRSVMRQAMHNDDPAFRKAHLRMFVSKTMVKIGTVSIDGPRSALATAVGRDHEPSAIDGAQIHRKWRPNCDKSGHWTLLICLHS